jgi:hypothetical protein
MNELAEVAPAFVKMAHRIVSIPTGAYRPPGLAMGWLPLGGLGRYAANADQARPSQCQPIHIGKLLGPHARHMCGRMPGGVGAR